MRMRLIEAVAAGHAQDLMPLVSDSIKAHQTKLRPLASSAK
jgi:hypothetical protein